MDVQGYTNASKDRKSERGLYIHTLSHPCDRDKRLWHKRLSKNQILNGF